MTAAVPILTYGIVLAGACGVSYLIGSIPWAYIIVRSVTGEDITEHGTGNVGAMNVRRSTGSWAWFVTAMVADAMKGFVPTLAARIAAAAWAAPLLGVGASSEAALLLPQVAVFGAVLGHNYSLWMAVVHRRFGRTGKGLATGGGALLAYDWRYFLVVVAVGLLFIAVTRYMMAGQVAAAVALPLASVAFGAEDLAFTALMGALVYAAHHRRFIGMLEGREPRLYVNDRMGPRG